MTTSRSALRPTAGVSAVIREGLAAIRPRHVAGAVAIGAGWGLANAFGWWLGGDTRNVLITAGHFVYEGTLTMLVLVLTVAVADRMAEGDPEAIAPYAIAAITAALLGEMLFTATAPLLGLAKCSCSMDRMERIVSSANMLPDSLIICGFVTAGYRFQKRTSQRLGRVRARELERAQITRRMVESRLQAMQACIEPQFLFDTLHDIETLHRTQPRTAIRLIDELIVYLRAALPHLRESTSTVAKETELAHAWLNIRRLRTGGGPALTVDIGHDAAEARLPPMILLPLVDHLLGDPVTNPHAALDVVARVAEARLRIALSLRDAGHGESGRPDTLAGVRERLALLYGPVARLTLGSDAAATVTLTLDIPHESTDSHHR